MKYNVKFAKIEEGYYRAKINNVELYEVDELLVWTIKEREKLIIELKDKINKANEILNKGCFEYDNCPDSVINEVEELKEILGDDENVK